MKKLAAVLVILLVAGAAGTAWWFYSGVDRPFKGYATPEIFVEIPQGTGSVAIAKRLADAGVVHDVNSFRLALWITGAGRRLQAGEYRFDRPVSPRQPDDDRGKTILVPLQRTDFFGKPSGRGRDVRVVRELLPRRREQSGRIRQRQPDPPLAVIDAQRAHEVRVPCSRWLRPALATPRFPIPNSQLPTRFTDL